MLAFIETLDDPFVAGVNPEVAHETMAGLNFVHAVAQALAMGKLFHIDLNGQAIGRYDQDFRFGQEDIKGAFFLVKLLEDYKYEGSRHFDAHPLRTEGAEGVWDFAAGCMRTYLILREKAQRFNADSEIQGLLREVTADSDGLGSVLRGGYSADSARRLNELSIDRIAYGKKDLRCEKLDQLTTEILLGVR
jgi:xylose isomerase